MILTFWWRRHKQTNKIILEEIGAIETIKQDNGKENFQKATRQKDFGLLPQTKDY